MALKSFYRLKDTGTSFYDSTQGKGVVVDKIAPLENTATVLVAVRDGVLIKLDPSEGKKLYAAQQKADGVQEEDEDSPATTEDPAKVAPEEEGEAPRKSPVPPKK